MIVYFENIFLKHKEYLEGEECYSIIEKVLEDEYECYLKIRFSSGAKKEDIAKVLELSDEENGGQFNEKYAKDKNLKILQTIMGATIRTIYTDRPKIQYSLGDSCNFNEE